MTAGSKPGAHAAMPRSSCSSKLPALLRQIRSCTSCAAQLPHEPRPVLQAQRQARILIAGQAPGRRVHASGIPFDDASGERLRDWMGIGRAVFYDPRLVAIVPMGFCFPGSANGADLPPRPQCAHQWRRQLLDQLPQVELTLVIGSYALRWHLPQAPASVTAAVRQWRGHVPSVLPLPHPSPRNNGWLKANPWFGLELLPALRARVAEALRR